MQNELDIVRDISTKLDAAGCDQDYIARWTEELEVTNLWQSCRA